MKKIMEPRDVSHVVILGMGLSGYSWVRQQYVEPFDLSDPKKLVIGINNASFAYRTNMAVFMDDLKNEKEEVFKSFDSIDIPVMTSRSYAEWKNSYDFPLKEVVETFNDVYLRNSIAYAVAWALLCFVKFKVKDPTLELFGCDFNYEGGHNPWERGRGCVEWWLRHAKHLSVNVKLPQETLLLDIAAIEKNGLYGYHTQPEFELVNGRYRVVERDWVEPEETGNVRELTPEEIATREAKLVADAPASRIIAKHLAPNSRGL